MNFRVNLGCGGCVVGELIFVIFCYFDAFAVLVINTTEHMSNTS